MQRRDNWAVSSDGRDFKYSDLIRDVTDTTKLLAGLAVRPYPAKDRDPSSDELVQTKFAFLFHPSYEYIVANWAIWGVGSVAVPLHPSHPEPELEYIIMDSQATAILVHPELRHKVQSIADKLGLAIVEVNSFAPTTATTSSSSAPTTTTTNTPSSSASTPTSPTGDSTPVVPVPAPSSSSTSPFDPPVFIPPLTSNAYFIYTSGTTGKPKGVCVRHKALLAQVTGLVAAWRWSQTDRITNVLPLHHVHGVVNVVGCAMWSGAHVTFLPSGSGFNAKNVWKQWIEGRELQQRCAAAAAAGTMFAGAASTQTLFMAVPTIYERLSAEYDASPPDMQAKMRNACKQFRLMVSGSMALPVPTMEKWREISGHTLLERYGMTEIGMALTNPLHGERKPGFVGMPLPGVSVALRTMSGNDEAEDKRAAAEAGLVAVGELLVRGPTVFKRYWNKPEATASSFHDKWFMTGDIAGVDADGYFKILGRASADILKVSGYKISALDIERDCLSHPKIAEIAVLGLPSAQYGQTIAAIVVLKKKVQSGSEEKDATLTLAELREWAKDKMAPYKIPRVLWVVDEIPRNAMGKVNKKHLAGLVPKELIPAE